MPASENLHRAQSTEHRAQSTEADSCTAANRPVHKIGVRRIRYVPRYPGKTRSETRQIQSGSIQCSYRHTEQEPIRPLRSWSHPPGWGGRPTPATIAQYMEVCLVLGPDPERIAQEAQGPCPPGIILLRLRSHSDFVAGWG